MRVLPTRTAKPLFVPGPTTDCIEMPNTGLGGSFDATFSSVLGGGGVLGGGSFTLVRSRGLGGGGLGGSSTLGGGGGGGFTTATSRTCLGFGGALRAAA